MAEHQMILEDDDCKQKEKDLNVEELMEVVRMVIVKVGLVAKVGLVVKEHGCPHVWFW